MLFQDRITRKDRQIRNDRQLEKQVDGQIDILNVVLGQIESQIDIFDVVLGQNDFKRQIAQIDTRQLDRQPGIYIDS